MVVTVKFTIWLAPLVLVKVWLMVPVPDAVPEVTVTPLGRLPLVQLKVGLPELVGT